MLTTSFSFKGVVGRQAFMLGTLAITGVVLLLAAAAGIFIVAAGGAGSPALGQMALLGGVLAVLACWPTTALYVKRLRDLGVGLFAALAILYGPTLGGALVERVAGGLPAPVAFSAKVIFSLINLAVFVACCALKPRIESGLGGSGTTPRHSPVQTYASTASIAQRTQFGQRGV